MKASVEVKPAAAAAAVTATNPNNPTNGQMDHNRPVSKSSSPAEQSDAAAKNGTEPVIGSHASNSQASEQPKSPENPNFPEEVRRSVKLIKASEKVITTQTQKSNPTDKPNQIVYTEPIPSQKPKPSEKSNVSEKSCTASPSNANVTEQPKPAEKIQNPAAQHVAEKVKPAKKQAPIVKPQSENLPTNELTQTTESRKRSIKEAIPFSITPKRHKTIAYKTAVKSPYGSLSERKLTARKSPLASGKSSKATSRTKDGNAKSKSVKAKGKDAKAKNTVAETKVITNGKRGTAPMLSEGPPDEPIDGGWPKGWIKRTFKRMSGKSKGHTDRYWYPPESTSASVFKLRSMIEVKRFMAALKETGDFDQAWKKRRG